MAEKLKVTTLNSVYYIEGDKVVKIESNSPSGIHGEILDYPSIKTPPAIGQSMEGWGWYTSKVKAIEDITVAGHYGSLTGFEKRIYKVAEKLGADSELLSILGSYKNTQSDEDVVSFLDTWLKGESIFKEVYAEVPKVNPNLN